MAKKHQTKDPILEDQLGLNQSESESVDSDVKQDPKPADAEVLTDGLAKPKPVDLRPWYKRPKLWAIGLLGLLIVLLIVFGLLSWRNRQAQASWMQDQWRDVRQKSERVTQEAERGRYDSFDDTVRALSDLQDTVDDGITDSAKQPTFLTDASNVRTYKEMLDQLKTYTSKAQSEAADLSAVGSTELDELKSLATATKIKVGKERAAITGLSDDLQDSFYTLDERYKTVIDEYTTAEDEAKAKETAAKSKEEQAKQNQTDAEESVTRWIQGYVAGTVGDMKKYMTSAFASEFNFSEVTSNYRQYNYPTTFRRVSTDKKSDSFEIVSAITFVSKWDYGAESTYSNNYSFSVTQDKTSKKWLVNSRNP